MELLHQGVLERARPLSSQGLGVAPHLLSLIYLFIFITYSSIVYVRAIHEIFVAEEWVKDAKNEARVEVNLHIKTNKALGAAKQINQELTTKLTAEERVRKNAEAGLKNA